MNALQYLDVIFVVVGAIVALLLGAPSLGVIIGAAGWILQRVMQVVDRRLTATGRRLRCDVRASALFEAFGRIWLLAGAIIVSAVVGDRKDGLAAAIRDLCRLQRGVCDACDERPAAGKEPRRR